HPTYAWTLGHQDDAAIPQHHRRRVASGADRRVGTSATVESGQSVTTSHHFEPLRIVSHLSVAMKLRVRLMWNGLRKAVCQPEARERFTGERWVARPAGLEPATSWFVARRSIQLS